MVYRQLIISLSVINMGIFLTDPKCIKQRECVNIPVWHEAGHTGKGITVFHDDIGGSRGKANAKRS